MSNIKEIKEMWCEDVNWFEEAPVESGRSQPAYYTAV